MELIKLDCPTGLQKKLSESEYGYAKKLLEIVGVDEEPIAYFTTMKVGVHWKPTCGIVLPSGRYRFAKAVLKGIHGNLITGLFFGYPICCINYFLGVRNNRDVKIDQRTNGYLQCPECSKLPPEEVIAGINSRRVCHSPFPIDRDESDIMHRWYYAATTDFTEYCKE